LLASALCLLVAMVLSLRVTEPIRSLSAATAALEQACWAPALP